MNIARTGLLLAALTALFLACGWVIGGQQGAAIALVMAIAMNGFALWNSDKMVLRMHHAQPLSPASAPDLYRLVQDLAERAGLPMPALYLIESEQPNAFATGRDPWHAAVAVTRGLLRALDRDQVAGVIAHELAHIRNRDTLTMTVAATFAGAIGFLGSFAFFFGGTRDGERANPLASLLVMLLAPLAATLVQMAISRTREFSADRLGAEISGRPAALAGALRRIEQIANGTHIPSAERNPATAHLFIISPLHGGGMTALFRSHPPTEQRIAQLLALDTEPVSPAVRASAATQAGGRRGPWG